MTLFADRVDSPVGGIDLAVNEAGALVRIAFLGIRAERKPPRELTGGEVVRDPEVCREARGQLEEYFRRERRTFELDLAPRGSPFQLRVWEELRRIPYGETIGYGELARRIGLPDAQRAVGSANHVNPLPIVIPCHRVRGANGELVGFGGGLAVQRALLDLESGQGSLLDYAG